MLKILFCFSDGYSEYNSSHFRVSVMADELNKLPDVETLAINIKDWIHNSYISQMLTEWADIVVLQRVLVNELMPRVEAIMRTGTKVICDWDDAYDLIGEENAAYKFWGEGKAWGHTKHGIKYQFDIPEHPVDQMKKNLPKISHATMPSRVIASDWKDYVNTRFLPNFIDQRYWDVSRIETASTLIGWGGSLSHLTSFSSSGVQEGIRRVLNRYDNTMFLLCGDERIKKQLPFDNVAFRHYVTWREWPNTLALYDIGIAPIAMPYDARRSWLKVAEYIAAGIPFVATKGAPYEDFFKCKSGIFIDQGELTEIDRPNPQAWFEALEEVFVNIDKYRQIAQEEREKYRQLIHVEENAEWIKGFYYNLK